MTLLEEGPAGAEALIREARERQRRRRRRMAVAGLILVAAGAVGYATTTSGGSAGARPRKPVTSRPPPAAAPQRPLVDAAALHGHGSLAFISRGSLWLVDGATETTDQLAVAADRPQTPTFSADGRWLAFVTSPRRRPRNIVVVRADGSHPHLVPLPHPGDVMWSPTGNRLMVTSARRHSEVSAVNVLEPRGARIVAHVHDLTDAVWSPNGRAIAVTTTDQPRGRTSILTYPVSGGAGTTWFSVDNRHARLAGKNGLLLEPAGWWPGRGIGFWVVGDGQVNSLDKTPLYLIHAPSATPQRLGATLSNRTAVSSAHNGRLATVETGRAGRVLWQQKRVRVCLERSGGCRLLPSPQHTVTLDPSWSPNGRTLAFVRAPTRRSVGFPQHVVRSWYAAHTLELYDAARHTVRTIPGATGVSVPQWSRDGRTLLYVAKDGVWLLARGSHVPQRIATPLYPPRRWPAFYGQVPWVTQFAWSAR
jgi:TolB protein